MKQKEVQAVSVLQENKKGQKMKHTILLILLLIAGAVVGSFMASITGDIQGLNWLAFSKGVSISPFTINLVIFSLTFGVDFSMSIAQVIFMIIAVAFYPKLKAAIG